MHSSYLIAIRRTGEAVPLTSTLGQLDPSIYEKVIYAGSRRSDQDKLLSLYHPDVLRSMVPIPSSDRYFRSK
jgi:hypothetical protein